MAEYILIGVGGTGAKIVEAALPLFLAGLGPNAVTVGFVDQDQANGNTSRARHQLQLYETFKNTWSSEGKRPSSLDWASPESKGGTMLGRIAVRPFAPGHELWCPHPNPGATLQSIFDHSLLPDDQKELMNLLYEPGDSEQLMKLGEGYRARPHIGAAAMMSQAAGESEFWRPLREKVKAAAGGEEVRIFFAGSVFGGTGAAGFPTIARVLRRIVADSKEPLRGKVHLGGALMLPYFTFDAPPNDNENAARAEQLLTQSRAALKYYEELFKREAIFDELYLVGWSPRFKLGYNSSGGGNQANPPLPPELLAALSAVRFLDPTARDLPREPSNTTFISARDKADALQWSDLPEIADARGAETYERISQLLRFCSVWRNTIKPALRPRLMGDSWYRNQDLRQVDFRATSNTESLKALNDLVDNTLVWAVAMAGFAKRGGLANFGLWDTTRLGRIVPENLQEPVVLNDLGNSDAPAAYDNLITPAHGQGRPPGQSVLFEELSNQRYPGAHTGLGRIVAATFHGARVKAASLASA